MAVRIFSDSTCDLGKELTERYSVTIVPLCIVMGDKSYYDGEEMGASELNMMRDMGMNVTLELRDDGKASLMLFDEEMAGTWKLNSENSISVTFEGVCTC